MAWSPFVRRVTEGLSLTLAVLTIAHATNAFIADALQAPVDSNTRPVSTPDPTNLFDSVPPQQQVDDILQSGLFELPATFLSMKDGGAAAVPAVPPPPIEAARKVALLGSVLGNAGGVMAVFEDLTSKHQDLYRLGADIPNVGILAVIEKDRVLFRNGPSEEWLPLALTQQPTDGSSNFVPPPIRPQGEPARRVLDRREVTAALNDPTRLMTQAQAVPFLSEGKLDGFRLYSVLPAGFFDKVGLRTNDVVQRINGVELRDPGMLLSLFQQLRNERTVRIDLVRNTQRQTLTYEIR